MSRLGALVRLAATDIQGLLRRMRSRRFWIILIVLVVVGQGIGMLKQNVAALRQVAEINVELRNALWDVNPFLFAARLSSHLRDCHYVSGAGVSCGSSSVDFATVARFCGPYLEQGLVCPYDEQFGRGGSARSVVERIWAFVAVPAVAIGLSIADIWAGGWPAILVLLTTLGLAIFVAIRTLFEDQRGAILILVGAVPFLAGILAFVLLVLLVLFSFLFGAVVGLLVFLLGPVVGGLIWFTQTVRQADGLAAGRPESGIPWPAQNPPPAGPAA